MDLSILGTNGFLSTAIARYANERGWYLSMYGLDSPTSHHYDNFYRINLMDVELDYSILLNSDIIIYAIGAGIQSNLKEDNNLIYSLNTTAPVAICNKLNELGYKGIFITFGSYFEIGETSRTTFFTEQDILSSTCPAPNDYVISKRMLSRFVSSYKHSFTHWHFYIPTIYGSGENSHRLIPYTINAILNGNELHFTDGGQIRQYVHVSEIPRSIDLAIQHKLPSGLYNIEGKDTLSVKEIVKIIHSYFGKNIPDGCFGSIQRRDVSMRYLALDGKKLRDAIGYVASLSLKDTINSYL